MNPSATSSAAALARRLVALRHRAASSTAPLSSVTLSVDAAAGRRASSSSHGEQPARPPRRDQHFSVRTPRPRHPRNGYGDSAKFVGRSTNGRDAAGRAASNRSDTSMQQHDRLPGPAREAVLSLRAALVGQDYDAVWACWEKLETTGERLSVRDQAGILELCLRRIHPAAPAFSSSSPSRDLPIRPEPWDDRCWSWALAAVETRNPQLLAGWAKLAIIARRFELVDELVERVVAGRGEEAVDAQTKASLPAQDAARPGGDDAGEDAGQAGAGAGMAVDDDVAAAASSHETTTAPSAKAPHRLGRLDQQAMYHELLACLVTAKAIRDDLRGLVATMRRIDIGAIFNAFFKPNKVAEVANDLFRQLRSRDLSCVAPSSSSSSSLSSTAPPPPVPAVPADMEDLRVLRDRVDRFVSQAELARCHSSSVDSSRRIARLLGSLFNLRRPDAVWPLFEAAMEATTGSEAWLPLQGAKPGRPEEQTEGPAGLAWTESCWAVCLSGFLAAGKPDLALKVWAKYHELGFQPTLRIYNALLDGYSRAKNYEAAVRTWHQITAPKPAATNAGDASGAPPSAAAASPPAIVPDATMCTTMISIFFRNRQPGAARQLFEEMRRRHASSTDEFRIPTEACNAIVHGLCVNGQTDEAQAVLVQMQERGPPPSITTVNALLRAHGRSGDLASLAATLRIVGQLQLKPDVVTFTTVLDALLRKGGNPAGDSVRRILEMMEGMGVRANAVTYTALIKACLVGSEALGVDLAAESLFSSHHRGGGRGADAGGAARTTTATAASSGSSDGRGGPAPGPVAGDARIDAALELLDRMIKMRISPTEVTYTALIGAVLQNPQVVAYAFEQGQIPAQYAVVPRPLRALQETADTVREWRDRTPDVLLGGSGALEAALEDRSTLARAGSLSYASWVVILSGLSARLEHGAADPAQRRECARALRTALHLMRVCGADELKGTDGGRALVRIAEGARTLLGTMRV
ncbi:uncharacterized protein PFL1_04384 [Pseudozyma flocculosa PF-1]|uniref:Pentacotripeptide-repeat region of PRORP domain-containing protein n=1 Tax=Pseudozyma flocculosa PF-1 TaxID=1277687 RepID=A0A061H597_9BASI|nr:uncharacterized protein PFL1_04384 [Pseudozyma flocculosa PF-1]EPQ28057.1 hypothetical protein PFL1_04384 [Pseudozyma flocculosa PF-1]